MIIAPASTERERRSRIMVLGVQLCFRRFPIDGFSGSRNK